MPDVDGLQVLRHVQSNETLRDLPVVIMSASEETDCIQKCIRGGAEEYLLKPITKKEVQHIWQHVLKKSAKRPAPGPPGIAPEAGSSGSGAQARATARFILLALIARDRRLRTRLICGCCKGIGMHTIPRAAAHAPG